MEQNKKVRIIYANAEYEITFKGERVLHLRSIMDRSLTIHVSANSVLLKNKEPEGTERNNIEQLNGTKDTRV